MKALYLAALPLAMAPAAYGAPLIKSAIITLSVDGVVESGAYDVASVGASFAVEHPGLFDPLISVIPGARGVFAAARLLGGRFAGTAAGGFVSRAAKGFLEGSAGNDAPLVGWIIREQEDSQPEELGLQPPQPTARE
ncbi:hypothetical protein H4R18_002023 [Coemansia javaensis]|uniref:Uncharacterized protein n=1 Tax=Coemansia javaensis TaxID=2761396 RepID=A0A9W8LKI5_9FUNG|nr:hypothetical protein H4R18_002023 [Coemansia javaensis]